MSEGSERTKDRLENLQNLEPLIGAMRILALRTVQMTLNRLENVAAYRSNFVRALMMIQAEAIRRRKAVEAKPRAKPETIAADDRQRRPLLIVLGSESGLCGGFDRGLLSVLRERIAEEPESDFVIEIFGEKMLTRLKKETFPYRPLGSLSRNGNPNYAAISERIASWFQRFDSGETSSVELVSFRKSDFGSYQPTTTVMLPIAREETPSAAQSVSDADWPPPLIEGDPAEMIEELRRHVAMTQFYACLLESIAAENQARFRLLEEAKENTASLIEELKIQAQLERRQATTQQIQELAVSAGLVR